MNFAQRYITMLLAGLLFAGCLGTGESPRQFANQELDDSVVGRLLRELGPAEVNIILADPTLEEPAPPDITAGLTNFELLYTVDRVSLDTLIELVKKMGATRAVKFIRSMQRLGCNAVGVTPEITPQTPQPDIVARCKFEQFPYLDVLIDLMNSVKTLDHLAVVATNQNLGGPSADFRIYIETLAHLAVELYQRRGAGGIDTIAGVLNGIIDGRDLAHIVNSFALDNAAEIAPAFHFSQAQADFTPPSTSLVLQKRLARLMWELSGDKLAPIANGVRPIGGDDAMQRSYLEDKLIVILKGPACADPPAIPADTPFAGVPPAYCGLWGTYAASDEWIDRLVFYISSMPDTNRIRELLVNLTIPSVASVIEIFARIDFEGATGIAEPANYQTSPCGSAGGNAAPWDANNPTNSLHSLVHMLSGVADNRKIIHLLDNIAASQLVTVLDDISYTSVVNNGGGCDLTAAGVKFAAMLEEIAFEPDPPSPILGKIQTLMNVINEVTNVSKLAYFVNYLRVPEAGILGARKVGMLMNLLTDPPLLPADTPMVRLMNLLDNPAFPTIDDNAIFTAAYSIDNLQNLQVLADLIEQADPLNLSVLLNDVALSSQTDDLGGADRSAAGQKIVKAINLTYDASDIVFILSEVSDIGKVADILNRLPIGATPEEGAGRIPFIINTAAGSCADISLYTAAECLAGSSVWTPAIDAAGAAGPAHPPPGFRGTTMTGMGKLVNLIDFVNNGTLVQDDIPYIIEQVADGRKMGLLIREVGNSSNLVGLLNGIVNDVNPDCGLSVITPPCAILYSDRDDLVGLLNALAMTDVGKTAAVINAMTVPASEVGLATVPSTDQLLLGQLLGKHAAGGDVSQGVGFMQIAVLLQWLDASLATRLATLLEGLNVSGGNDLIYNSTLPNVSRREGLVRIISGHVANQYSLFAVNLPGMGPWHTAEVINGAAQVSDLVAMINQANLVDMLVIVGCGDHIGDLDGSGLGWDDLDFDTQWTLGREQPNFFTPCQAIGEW